MTTCEKCLNGVHVRCRVLDCACFCRKVTQRPPRSIPDAPRRQRRKEEAGSRPSRAGFDYEWKNRRVIEAVDIEAAIELREEGKSWRQVGVTLGLEHSGIRKAVLRSTKLSSC